MKRVQYKIRPNVVLKNRLNSETVIGDIVGERDIEGKQYWVLSCPDRGGARLSYAKESWSIKGK
jgi:hypothetical protein